MKKARRSSAMAMQRVLRARFKDARFFWDFDQKTPLVDRVESLKTVTFQKELGSYHWKTEQNLAVATRIGSGGEGRTAWRSTRRALLKAVGAGEDRPDDRAGEGVHRAAGIIGGLYARAQGLGETVAQAIYAQYTPASTEDAIPPTVEGQLLGLADRIQTITAMFRIGMAPTGSKDPFALRRAANAIVKILAESELAADTERCDAQAQQQAMADKPRAESRSRLFCGSGCISI